MAQDLHHMGVTTVALWHSAPPLSTVPTESQPKGSHGDRPDAVPGLVKNGIYQITPQIPLMKVGQRKLQGVMRPLLGMNSICFVKLLCPASGSRCPLHTRPSCFPLSTPSLLLVWLFAVLYLCLCVRSPDGSWTPSWCTEERLKSLRLSVNASHLLL